jgi:hypothetical protein
MRSRSKADEPEAIEVQGDRKLSRDTEKAPGDAYQYQTSKGKLKGRSRSNSRLILLIGIGAALVLCTLVALVNEAPVAESDVRLGTLSTAKRLVDADPAKIDGASCRYDGHCGTSETCSVASGGIQGVCEPFAPKKDAKRSDASQACFDACMEELQIDEHWYQEMWPVVDWSEDITSQGRPIGCLIVYHREPQGDRFNYLDEQDRQEQPLYEGLPPSLVHWVENRFRHIKRVDPLSGDMNDNRWVALCTAPCTSDTDCSTKNDAGVPGFVCQTGACMRNPQFWGPEVPASETPRDQMEAAADMVLVTGVTSAYYIGLTNLAASARYWAPQYGMVVYNLGGLSTEQIASVRSWSNVLAVEWEDGVPEHYPPHIREGKVYAWKPIIVNETVHKYGSIFWLDGGSTLAGPIQPMQVALQHHGIALMKGQDLDMRERSNDKSFEWFGYDKGSMPVGPHFSGNTQAFMHPSRYIDTVVIPNTRCALDPSCIAPPGSDLGNHRYDQTTISILAYQPKVRLPHYTEFLAASAGQLNPDLTQPSFRFVWTSRATCNFYSIRDPELQGKPPDGGYFRYVPEPRAEPDMVRRIISRHRHSLYRGPDSVEGGEEIPDEPNLVRSAGRNVRLDLNVAH